MTCSFYIAFTIPLPKISNFRENLPRSSTFQEWANAGLVVPETAHKDVLWGLNVPSRTVEPIKLRGNLREERTMAKQTTPSHHGAKQQCPAFKL